MKAPKAIHVNFSFHPELCVGCGACVGACLDENDNLPIERPLLRSLHRVEQVRKSGANLLWYSLACLHCDSHDCWDACPKGCFSLDAATGTVQLDNTNCIGCHACEMACRYQAVVFEAAAFRPAAPMCRGLSTSRHYDRRPSHGADIGAKKIGKRFTGEKISRLIFATDYNKMIDRVCC